MKGYEVTCKPPSALGQDSINVEQRDHTRQVQGVTEDVGVMMAPDYDQRGGAMEAKLYGDEMGIEGDLQVTKGKSRLSGASDFDEVIRDIDDAIQYGIRSVESKEVNPYILLV